MVECASYDELVAVMEGKREGETILVVNSMLYPVRDLDGEVRSAERLMTVDRFIDQLQVTVMLSADFDFTLTTNNQFVVMGRELMTEELNNEDRAEAAEYFRGMNQTNRGHIAFINRTVERLAQSRVSLQHFNDAVDQSTPREGAVEIVNLFMSDRKCEEPVGIRSYGIGDWIEQWGAINCSDCYHELVIDALWLGWECSPLADADHPNSVHLFGCDLATAVTDYNKGYKTAIQCARCDVEYGQVLAIGDSPSIDFTLLTEGRDQKWLAGDPAPGVLGVMILPNATEQMDKHRRGGPLKKIWSAGLKAVLLGDSLMPLVELKQGIMPG